MGEKTQFHSRSHRYKYKVHKLTDFSGNLDKLKIEKHEKQGKGKKTSMCSNQFSEPDPNPFRKWYPGMLPSKQTAK